PDRRPTRPPDPSAARRPDPDPHTPPAPHRTPRPTPISTCEETHDRPRPARPHRAPRAARPGHRRDRPAHLLAPGGRAGGIPAGGVRVLLDPRGGRRAGPRAGLPPRGQRRAGPGALAGPSAGLARTGRARGAGA